MRFLILDSLPEQAAKQVVHFAMKVLSSMFASWSDLKQSHTAHGFEIQNIHFNDKERILRIRFKIVPQNIIARATSAGTLMLLRRGLDDLPLLCCFRLRGSDPALLLASLLP